MKYAWVAGLVAGVLAAPLLATSVFAHAEPARVKPGDGAVLSSPPLAIEMEMSQEMARQEGANDIDVFDATGKEVTVTAAAIDNGNRRRLTVALPSILARGAYVVKWRTVSADDGDGSDGATSFTIDPDSTASPGKEVLREDLLGGGGTAAAAGAAAALASDEGGGGTSWILVVAVAVGMFVVGAGSSWVVVQKRP